MGRGMGREGGSEREGSRGWKGERERGREGRGRGREWKGGREGGRKGGRKGGWEGWKGGFNQMTISNDSQL